MRRSLVELRRFDVGRQSDLWGMGMTSAHCLRQRRCGVLMQQYFAHMPRITTVLLLIELSKDYQCSPVTCCCRILFE